MQGQRIGYMRVSSVLQNIDRQLDGIELDRVFADHLSGKDTNRPQLEEMLQYARRGDVILVHSLDRLARNLDDLRRLVRKLTDKGVKVHFLKENLVFTGDDSPIANLMLSVMGAFAEFERSIIRERQREGVQIAKANGIYKGRKREMTVDRIADLKERVARGEPKAKIARSLGISRDTMYRYLRS